MLLSLDNATKMFAEKIIFMGASLKIEEGDRIGLVGVNGAGKSTLLNVLDGSLPLEQGERAARSGLSLGFLRQDSGLDGQNTIWEEMRGVFRPLLDAQAKAGRIAAQSGAGDRAIDLAIIAKYLERIADHGVNIARWAIFCVTGELVPEDPAE